jgi:NifU-like protein involved in Fe-S cluster formation
MDYSSDVRRRFLAPARAGTIPPEASNVVAGDAEDRSLEFWVRFQVQVNGRTIERMRFQAFGCPHAIAAADSVAADLEGKPVDALVGIDVEELALRTGLPREKFGKLLCIEDALADCHARLVTRDKE